MKLKKTLVQTILSMSLLVPTAAELAPKEPCNGAPGETYINHKRRNPQEGGFVANTAFVDESAYVGKAASVCGYSVVNGGKITGAAIIDGEATIDGGTIGGNALVTGDAIIKGGTIKGNSKISGGRIKGEDTIIDDSVEISGGTVENSTILDDAKITGGTINDYSTMKDHSELRGGLVTESATLKGYFRHKGGKLIGGEHWIGQPQSEIDFSIVYNLYKLQNEISKIMIKSGYEHYPIHPSKLKDGESLKRNMITLEEGLPSDHMCINSLEYTIDKKKYQVKFDFSKHLGLRGYSGIIVDDYIVAPTCLGDENNPEKNKFCGYFREPKQEQELVPKYTSELIGKIIELENFCTKNPRLQEITWEEGRKIRY